MKPVRWIFTWELATFRGSGHPIMHAYVDGSSAPLCMPSAEGEPPKGLGYDGGARCAVCGQKIQAAYWSWAPFGGGVVWTVRVGYPAPLKARGTAVDTTDAFRQCVDALGRLVPDDMPVEVHLGYRHDAEEYARDLRADARAARPSKGTGAQLTEYAYRHWKRYASWFSSAFEWETERAEIIKKTPKRIFVSAAMRSTEKGNTVLRTYSLDRAELESGKKSRYGWTLDPNPPLGARTEGKRAVPGWADVLGLEMPTTLAAAKRAFRAAAKKAHPDHGGTPEAFRRIKEAFDAAAQHFGGAA
ncbi:MAG: hypothetical protein KIS87_15220 [Phycisphaeraceae bacterium]|nr:hypothetical protein [Phycisphaeraceae bacterium]